MLVFARIPPRGAAKQFTHTYESCNKILNNNLEKKRRKMMHRRQWGGYGYGYGCDDIDEGYWYGEPNSVGGGYRYGGVSGRGLGGASAMDWSGYPESDFGTRFGARDGYMYSTGAETARMFSELDDIEERIRCLRRHGAYGAYGVIASGSPSGLGAGLRPGNAVERERIQGELNVLEDARERILRALDRRPGQPFAQQGRKFDPAVYRMGGPLPNAEPGLRAMSSVPSAAPASVEAMAKALEAKAEAIELKAKLARKSKSAGSGKSKKKSKKQKSSAKKQHGVSEAIANLGSLDKNLEAALRHSFHNERDLDQRVDDLSAAARAMLWSDHRDWGANEWARLRRDAPYSGERPWLADVPRGGYGRYYSRGPHPGQPRRHRRAHDYHPSVHRPYWFDEEYDRDMPSDPVDVPAKDDDVDTNQETEQSTNNGQDDGYVALTMKMEVLNQKLATLEAQADGIAGMSKQKKRGEPFNRLQRQRTSNLSHDPML